MNLENLRLGSHGQTYKKKKRKKKEFGQSWAGRFL
jgi:hypothetical protein